MPVYTYTTLDDPNGSNTQACGINNAGQIVGGYNMTNNQLTGDRLHRQCRRGLAVLGGRQLQQRPPAKPICCYATSIAASWRCMT
jgi:hypothetical protein